MSSEKRILIVDDEPEMVRGLKFNLEFDGYIIDTASNGIEGFEKIRSNNYNLIILDVMMPGMSGFDLCKECRNKKIHTPIILLTAKGEEIDKVLGLELGADDYITKPFSLRELLARIKAVLRRTDDFNNSSSYEIQIGQLNVDLRTFEASSGGQLIKMSSREIEVLEFLYQNKNQPVDRFDIMSSLWETDSEVTTRTIDNYIVKLRQKIEDDPSNPKHIVTIHGKGYKLNA